MACEIWDGVQDARSAFKMEAIVLFYTLSALQNVAVRHLLTQALSRSITSADLGSLTDRPSLHLDAIKRLLSTRLR